MNGFLTLALPKVAKQLCTAFRMLGKSSYILRVETDAVFARLPRVLRKESTASPGAVSGREIPSISRCALSTEGPAIDHLGQQGQ